MEVVRRVYDENGYLRALRTVSGDEIVNPYTNVGKLTVGWDEKLARKVIVGHIVWDGACHAQLTGWWETQSTLGPRAKITGLYHKGEAGWQEHPIENLIVANESAASPK
jgi:hypothetical protein